MDENKNIETLNNTLKDLVGTYDKLKRTIDQKEKEDMKELYLVRAGKGLEALVFYIVKREKINVTPKLPGQEITLDDHIFQLKKHNIVKKLIADDFYNIKNWRNKNSHFQDSESGSGPVLIRDSTIETVYDSFKEILKWFFEIYLKGEYADFSKNLYNRQEKTKEPTKEELDEIKRDFERNPLNILDFSILLQSKKVPKQRKKSNWLKSLIVLISISIGGYYFYAKYYAEPEINATTKIKTHLNKDQVLATIKRFQGSYNDVKFDAHHYFASHVDYYITDPNINNPTEIEIARKTNVEYIDPKSTIDPESLVLISKNDSISYWQFAAENVCYRTSKKKFEKCNVLMEYGINTDGKITRIKQIRYWNLQNSKKRPS